jgi:hypothetical protein
MIDFSKLLNLDADTLGESLNLTRAEEDKALGYLSIAKDKYNNSNGENSLQVLSFLPPMRMEMAIFCIIAWSMERSHDKATYNANHVVAGKLLKLLMELTPGAIKTGVINSRDCNDEKCKNCEHLEYCPVIDKPKGQKQASPSDLLQTLINSTKKGEA